MAQRRLLLLHSSFLLHHHAHHLFPSVYQPSALLSHQLLLSNAHKNSQNSSRNAHTRVHELHIVWVNRCNQQEGRGTTPRGRTGMTGLLYCQRSIIAKHSTGSRNGKSQVDIVSVHKENSSAASGGTFRKTVAWTSFGAFVMTVAGYFMYHSSERKGPITATRPSSIHSTPVVGKVAIGGPFRLVKHEGNIVTDRDFVGHWSVLYFGYTSCPDNCPEELQKLAEAVEKIDTRVNEKVVPVFVTIDPERDTGEQIQAYIGEFHPVFVGLTGTVDAIRQVAREFRVYYKKIEDEGSDYLVDHSHTMYLMDPNMEFVKFFGRDYSADDLTDAIVLEIKKARR
eukprot:c22393_g1_i1 orf=100-1116(+)